MFSYETGGRGDVVRAEVIDPEGTLRRVTLDERRILDQSMGQLSQSVDVSAFSP